MVFCYQNCSDLLWVKREYTDRETCDLLRQMREGTVVPQLRQEECIDIMVDVLSNTELHLNAAKGYLRTGMTVDLDGLQDQEIVREAGAFWDRARDAYQHKFRSRGYPGGTQRQATQLDRGGYQTHHQAIPDKQKQ